MQLNASILKTKLKHLLNGIGYDILRYNNNPDNSLLGIKKYPIKTIIDIGANNGQFAKKINAVFPDARIYCFEPLPVPFSKLLNFAEKSGIKIVAKQLALGDVVGEAEIHHHLDHSPSSSILNTTSLNSDLYPQTKKQEKLIIKMDKLDNVFSSIVIEPEVLVKIDVQGYEGNVIKGGEKVLGNSKACIIEINLKNLYANQTHWMEIFTTFHKLKFNYAGNLEQFYDSSGRVVFTDSLFIRED